jgi:hypothetical protein
MQLIVRNFDMRRTQNAMNLLIAKIYAEANKETSRRRMIFAASRQNFLAREGVPHCASICFDS